MSEKLREAVKKARDYLMQVETDDSNIVSDVLELLGYGRSGIDFSPSWDIPEPSQETVEQLAQLKAEYDSANNIIERLEALVDKSCDNCHSKETKDFLTCRYCDLLSLNCWTPTHGKPAELKEG